MPEPRTVTPAQTGRTTTESAADAQHHRYQVLRRLGALAHQLRATTRAADHFIARGEPEDRDTGSWLMSGAVDQSGDVAAELDTVARSLKEAPADHALSQAVQSLRVRAHQLHAAARAADHFLDLDTRDDRETASWLIASARGLADKLAAEVDDAAGSGLRRGAEPGVVDAAEAGVVRRVSQATTPVRGVA